jgi:glucoamylase
MPRDIPIGNGDLLITFDAQYRLRDIYFPLVGGPNHTAGHVQRFGVWTDGEFAWIEHPSWHRQVLYRPDTLVTEVRLVNHKLGIELFTSDAVDFHEPVYIRRMTVRDLRGATREVRLFFHLDPSIDGIAVGDTANYDPGTSAIVIYKGDTYFLVNAGDHTTCGVGHWAIGTKRLGGAEGTWRDAEDGQLGRNAISQGSVDATIGINLQVPGGGEASASLWIAFGHSYRQVRDLSRRVWEIGPDRMLARTEAYWRLWARKENLETTPLPEPVRDLLYRSMLILRTQIDNRGAIIAANDSDITQWGGDHYSYCWPRDGALAAHALVLAGHSELSRSYFRYCARVVTEDGYFLHKYAASGALASSWHPWVIDGRKVLPIQQDETALVLWALRRHFEKFRDVEFVKALYEPLVVRPAEWMLSYRDHNGLPRPSWDLWEERRGVHTFTTAATIGALLAAAAFARDFGELDRAAAYAEGAQRMRGSLKRQLWRDDEQRFARTAVPLDDGTYRLDTTPDSSNCALFAFGAFAPDDPMVASQMKALRETLHVRTDVGGWARYRHDYYHQVERDEIDRVPGNPWVICTLWQAQHVIATARSIQELRGALTYLEWCAARALPSGVLAEQFHPYTGEPLSATPLTWSHAEVIVTCLQYLERHALLSRQGAATPAHKSGA